MDENTRFFQGAYNEAEVKFNNDELEECIELCQKILQKADCPRYFLIKTKILIASSVKDVSDAGEFCREAKMQFELAKSLYLAMNINADKVIEELQESLDSLYHEIARECYGGDLAKYDDDDDDDEQVEEAGSEQEESKLPTEEKLSEQFDTTTLGPEEACTTPTSPPPVSDRIDVPFSERNKATATEEHAQNRRAGPR